jgi:DNA-binding response OmpR family regulator
MSGESARILVVEDEAHLAAGIRENLELEGYAVEVAGDGLEALARIRDGGLELVVLDVMLPGMDGFTVCETVRSEGNEVPILFLTARTTADDRVRGLEAGGDDYLPKP